MNYTNMGYYSTFKLRILSADGSPDYTDDELVIVPALKAGMEQRKDYWIRSEVKWYDMPADLTKFSKQYPDKLFKMEVEGEENGDLWHFYALNGKSQECKAFVTYPPFDASLMK